MTHLSHTPHFTSRSHTHTHIHTPVTHLTNTALTMHHTQHLSLSLSHTHTHTSLHSHLTCTTHNTSHKPHTPFFLSSLHHARTSPHITLTLTHPSPILPHTNCKWNWGPSQLFHTSHHYCLCQAWIFDNENKKHCESWRFWAEWPISYSPFFSISIIIWIHLLKLIGIQIDRILSVDV